MKGHIFTVEEFVESCLHALDEHTPEWAVKEIVTSSMADPHELESALGTPSVAGITTLHRLPELTILNVIWPPGIALYPHDHNLWAVIGLYGGQEDNTFYTRNPDASGLVRMVLES
jgi:predicted metal-dependent enzyme (double-stranded beta helix superfamily)